MIIETIYPITIKEKNKTRIELRVLIADLTRYSVHKLSEFKESPEIGQKLMYNNKTHKYEKEV